MQRPHGDIPRDSADAPRWVRVVAPALLFGLALAVRALPRNGVFLPDGVQFYGNDAYYHMRRVAYSVAHFPAVLEFDRYINFPEGARPIWSPAFDWLVALALLPWRTGSLAQLEAVAVWVPPVLGATTVVALVLLARRYYGDRLAWLAGAILAVLSGHFWYSQIGFLDHHVAVALASTGLLAATMRWLEAPGGRPGARVDLPAIRVGAMAGLCLALWPGSLLHVAIAEGGVLVVLLGRVEREDAVRVARSAVWIHAAAFGVVAPLALGNRWSQWTAFSPVVLSHFQPWLFASAALFCAGCAALWRREGAGRDRLRRGVTAGGLAVAIVTASWLLWPDLGYGVVEAQAWLFKRDSFQGLVAESAPLFVRADRFTTRVAFERLSIFFALVPLALVAGVRVVRRSGHAPTAFLLFWTAVLCLVTVGQKRFFNSASVAVALLFALSLRWTFESLPADAREGRARRAATFAALALVAVGLLAPTLRSYGPYVRNLLESVERGEAIPLARRATVFRHAMNEAARWLRRHTPRTSGWLDPRQLPEYGVLAPWPMGHVIEYTGRRPTVTTNFGDDLGSENFLLAQRYYHGDEAEAARILDLLRTRYVVSPFERSFLAKPPTRAGMFHALSERDGRSLRRVDGTIVVPALRRHRLLWESRPVPGSGDRAWFKVFGYVPGAHVVGRAAPGREVRVSLDIRTNRERDFTWEARAVADERGVYEVRVPYANRPVRGGVTPGRRYTLACDGEEAFVTVDEARVRDGGRARGPDLCLAAP